MGFVLSFLEILRKLLCFVAFSQDGWFPPENPEILKMVTPKVTSLLKVALYRMDISKISPLDSPVNHFYF